ncbi:unnamed protein product [Ostreobium quekettii]|uniref:Transmembrane protein n=1 Tax=Ostreobium quekettii TaxID=121088 RepID=A0A8S1JBV0_9CHLO|nr:unnamed protein product [Ostreobium quekettii]
MALRSSNFTNNVAADNGGAVFTNAPTAIELCCDCTVEVGEDTSSLVSRQGRFSSGGGVSGPSVAVRRGILDHRDLCNRTWFGNGVREDGSRAVATTAVSARVYRRGTSARIDEDQAFSILNHSSGTYLEPFDMVLFDAFGRPTVAYPRTLIRVASGSPDVALSGQLITEASSRTALSSVHLLSSIGKRHNLTLYFEPDIGRNISIGVDVRGCLPGEFAVDVEGVGAAQHCNVCGDGLYSFDPARQRCLPCPADADCGPSTVTPKEGFWHSTSQSTAMRECLVEGACDYENRTEKLAGQAWFAHFRGTILNSANETAYEQCSSGYRGMLCGSCKETHGRAKSGECMRCRGTAGDVGIVVGLAVWFTLIAALMVTNALSTDTTGDAEDGDGNSPEQEQSCSTEIFQILINYLQTLGLAVAMHTKWTRAVYRVLGIAALVSTAGDNVFSLECAMSNESPARRSISESAVSLAFPFIMIALFSAAWWVLWRVNGRSMGNLNRYIWVSVLSILSLFYLDIADNSVRILNCTSVDGECVAGNPEDGCGEQPSRRWTEDPDIVCWQGQHLILASSAAVPLLFAVCLVYPLWILRFGGLPSSDLESEVFGFLHQSYNKDCKYWEAVIMARKGFLAGVSVFSFSLGSEGMSFLSITILFVAGIAHAWKKPFKSDRPNRMEILAITSSIMVFFLGSLFDNPNVQGSNPAKIAISVALIGQMLAFVAYVFVRLSIENWRDRFHKRESADDVLGRTSATGGPTLLPVTSSESSASIGSMGDSHGYTQRSPLVTRKSPL